MVLLQTTSIIWTITIKKKLHTIHWEQRHVTFEPFPGAPICVDTTCMPVEPSKKEEFVHVCGRHNNKHHRKYEIAVCTQTKKVIWVFPSGIPAHFLDISVFKWGLQKLLSHYNEYCWGDKGYIGATHALAPFKQYKGVELSKEKRYWNALHSTQCFQIIETGPNNFLKRFNICKLPFRNGSSLELKDDTVFVLLELYNINIDLSKK